MHRRSIPPARIVRDTIRMPMLRDYTRPLARQLVAETMDPPSAMRLIKTHPGQSRKLIGPVSTFQKFTRPPGSPNLPEQMAAGPPRMNARRLQSKTRGQGAGM